MVASRAITLPVGSVFDANRRDGLGMVLSGALPLSVFVIANGLAGLAGIVPLFFAPFGLPGWIGAVLHIASLPLFGVAHWMVVAEGREGRHAGHWLVALMAGAIVFPFAVTPLDPLFLCLATMILLLVGLATASLVAKVSPRAGLVMLPGLAWMGLSAFVGLSLVAGWSPPFGLTNSDAQTVS